MSGVLSLFEMISFREHYPVLNILPGVAARDAWRVPGSASEAGIDPSMDGVSSVTLSGRTNFLLVFVNALAILE